MSAERYDSEIAETNTSVYRLSDGSKHESQEAAEKYKAENYPDEDDYMASIRNPYIDRLLLGGSALTIGVAGMIIAKRHRNKEK
jgi:hypothetical protein